MLTVGDLFALVDRVQMMCGGTFLNRRRAAKSSSRYRPASQTRAAATSTRPILSCWQTVLAVITPDSETNIALDIVVTSMTDFQETARTSTKCWQDKRWAC